MTKPRWERKMVWVDDTEEAIKKRLLWMMRREWECVGSRRVASQPHKIGLLFRRLLSAKLRSES